eukprot:5148664-Amphidinium_carterae.1
MEGTAETYVCTDFKKEPKIRRNEKCDSDTNHKRHLILKQSAFIAYICHFRPNTQQQRLVESMLAELRHMALGA